MKQPGSDVHVHVFKLAFEHVEDILNSDFKYVWLLHFDSDTSGTDNSRHSMFFGELAKLLQALIDFTDIWWFV